MKNIVILLIVMAVASSASVASEVINFGDAGHSSTGGWSGGAEKYQTDTDNGATSTMDFTGLDNGTYYAWANWTIMGNRTTVAQYDLDGGAVSVQNQQLACDTWAAGDFWTQLGTISVLDGDLYVTASDLDGSGEAGEFLFLMSHGIRISTHPYHETAGEGMVIDDWYSSAPDFNTTGSWSLGGVPGYLDSEKYQSDPAGNDTATYTFTGLENGTYSVGATWSAVSNRTSDAVYTISDGGGAVHVDQRNAPSGINDEIEWQLLSEGVTVTDGTLEIVLSDNDAAGFLIADAIRISTKRYSETTSGALVVDNGDPSIGFSYTGTFSDTSLGYLGDEWFQTDPADPEADDTATFSFTGLENGTYSVSAVWTPMSNRTTDAVYIISDGGGDVHVDQMYFPDDSFDDAWWELLHTGVTVTDGTLEIVLSDNDPCAASYLMVDAVRIKLGGEPVREMGSGALVVDNGEASIGFSYTGAYTNIGGGYLGDEWYQTDPAGSDTATFSFTGIENGVYSVSAVWTELFNRTTDAVYTISDGGDDVHIDQCFAPGSIFDEVWWELLHTGVTVTDGNLVIVLSDDDSDPCAFLMADAVRIKLGGEPAPGTIFFTADFEDGEVNPGWLGGAYGGAGGAGATQNTTAYSATQPEAFGQIDNFGWQNRASNQVNGDTTIVDDVVCGVPAHDGNNCAEVEGRTLRSDIKHVLEPNSIYTFTFWMMIPEGNDLTFFNKVVVKDLDDDYLHVNTGNDDYTTALAPDTWFRRSVTFDTTDANNVGTEIWLRFGIWMSTVPAQEGWHGYTDKWSLKYRPKNPTGFIDVTEDMGIASAVNNDLAAAWGDYNNDGFVDLYVGQNNAAVNGILRNNSGISFTSFSSGHGATAGTWVDLDNDGDKDLTTSVAGGHTNRNDGGDSFANIDFTWVGDAQPCQSECEAWADYDNDGDLEPYKTGWTSNFKDSLYDANELNPTAHGYGYYDLIWDVADGSSSRGVTACDFDEDSDMDIYVSNYSLQPNYLWENDGTGSFTDVAVTYGVAGDVGADANYGFTIGSAWGDLDNDGHFDLVVVNFSHDNPEVTQDWPRFYRNEGPPNYHFENKTTAVNMTYMESHASPALGDFDNDGHLDVVVVPVYSGSDTCTLMRNNGLGDWTFTDVSALYGIDYVPDRNNYMATWGDFDNDGDLDLMIANKLFMSSMSSNGNHWLNVTLEGDGIVVNTDAVGAQVRITSPGLGTQTRQVETATGWGNQNDPRLHFGFGSDANDVDLEITWPDGTTETLYGVAVDQTVTIERCLVNFEDFAGLAAKWLVSPCHAGNNWCDGADLDESDEVDYDDLKELADEWLTTLCPGGWPL